MFFSVKELFPVRPRDSVSQGPDFIVSEAVLVIKLIFLTVERITSKAHLKFSGNDEGFSCHAITAFSSDNCPSRLPFHHFQPCSQISINAMTAHLEYRSPGQDSCAKPELGFFPSSA